MSRRNTNPLHSVGNLLVADLDEHTFGFIHPRTVPFIQSPLTVSEVDSSKSSADFQEARSAHAPNENYETTVPNHKQHDRAALEPSLRYHHESNTIELFYDLFFVANLTNFTGKHEVTNTSSMFF
jgi:hypothetical protein